jgi:hypothetical protein
LGLLVAYIVTVARSPRSSWVRLRRAAAALLAVSAITGASTLFFPWHSVKTVDPASIAGALYFGPDYNVSAAERARMLSRSYEWECTGTTHLDRGAWPIAVLVVVLASAIAALLWPPRGASVLVPAIGAFLVTFVALYFLFFWGFLQHLFDGVGPPRPAEIVFTGAEVALAACACLLLLATGVEALRR